MAMKGTSFSHTFEMTFTPPKMTTDTMMTMASPMPQAGTPGDVYKRQVLGHAVDELHDAARLEAAELGLAGGRIRALHGQGHPEDGADLAFPVGGIEGELGATGGRGGTGDRPANAGSRLVVSTHGKHPFRSSRVSVPARRTRGASPVQSSTVEAVPDAGDGTG